MADGKIILLPYMDVAGSQHNGYPEDGNLYRWIDEYPNCDTDSTYIYAPSPGGEYREYFQNSIMSAFLLEGGIPNKKIKVTNAKLKYNAKSVVEANAAYINFTAYCFGLNSVSETTGYLSVTDYATTQYEYTLSNEWVQAINDHISKYGKGKFPSIQVWVETVNGYTTWKAGSGGYTYYDFHEVRLSQLYLEIEYEEILDIGIHRQVNGAVKAAVAAYKKVDGTWQEIDEAEAKSILKNNTITQGGS